MRELEFTKVSLNAVIDSFDFKRLYYENEVESSLTIDKEYAYEHLYDDILFELKDEFANIDFQKVSPLFILSVATNKLIDRKSVV